MRRDKISATILVMLLIGAPILRPVTMTSCALTLAIVLLYGLILKVAGMSNGSTGFPAILSYGALGTLAAPAGAILLYRWSLAVGLSLPSSLVVWTGVIVAGAAYVQLASRWEQSRSPIAAARAPELPA